MTVSDLPAEGDKPPQNRVYDDLLSHRDVICVPYQRLSDARYNLGVHWFHKGLFQNVIVVLLVFTDSVHSCA